MILNVRHNFTDADGLHQPKWDSTRIVSLPDVVLDAVKKCRIFSPFPEGAFVLWNLRDPTAPMSVQAIQAGFSRILDAIGIPPEMATIRRITFHSTRHSFVSMSLSSGISPHIVELIAGHTEGGKMQKRYTHGTILDFSQARVLLENTVKP